MHLKLKNCKPNNLRIMEKSRLNLVILIASAIMLSSCGGINKMKKQYGEVKYNVTPSPLELHAGKVAVDVKGNFPEKFFHKKAILELTPVLTYENGQTALESVTLQGANVEANNKVISFDGGGNFSYSDTVDYVDGMFRSDLMISGVGYLQGKEDAKAPFDSVKIAEGVVATSNLVQNTPEVIMEPDQFQRITEESLNADIHYLIERSDLRYNELTKEDIKTLENMLKEISKSEKMNFKEAKISSYASPDGPIDLNERLSEGRKSSASNYVNKKVRSANIKTEKETDYEYKTTTEDWENFKKLVQNSEIEDKELILRVLSMHSDPEVREKELENMAATWEVLADDILPKLRRSEIFINFEKVGYSDEEISELSKNNPDTLNIEEMLYATTLTEDLAMKQSILEAATNKFPDSYRAYNNLGAIHYLQDNLDQAKSLFDTAKGIKDTDAVNNNLGAIALKNNNLQKAEELFTSAMGAGDAVNYNLGIVNIMKGQYDEAVNYFGNVCKANAGLAKILQGNTEEAVKNLECVEDPDAVVYYLKAIIGAKTNNDNMFYENLRSAAAKSDELKKRAARDIVFAKKYSNDETFKSIVE